jgi:quercetin dioxygenase-like cupin family protein
MDGTRDEAHARPEPPAVVSRVHEPRLRMEAAMRKKKVLGVAMVATSLATMIGVAIATPGSGVTVTPVASASVGNRIGIHQAAGESTVVADFSIAPDGTTGWHSHPGKTLVLVTAGEFTLYRDKDGQCKTRTYEAGEGFVEKRTSVHTGVNEGTDAVELTAVFFRVPKDGTTRIDKPDPGVC